MKKLLFTLLIIPSFVFGQRTNNQQTQTGTGSSVNSTSPTLITPDLGTPSAIVLTNATGTPSSINVGNATGSLASTGSRITKGWFTDVESTNMPTVGGTSLSSTFQASDADLTTIAGLTATTDNFIVSVSSAWASRTPAQVKTTLSLNNVDNTSDATKNSATAELTNKTITKRSGTTTSSTTPTINADNVDLYTITAQTADITSMTTNFTLPTNDGDEIEIWITGTATRNITWGASFSASSIALPTATSGTSTLHCLFVKSGSVMVIKGYY